MIRILIALLVLIHLPSWSQENGIRPAFEIKSPTLKGVANSSDLNIVFSKLHIPEKLPPGQYKLVIAFIVNMDNSISNIRILRDPGNGVGEALKNLTSTLPEKEPEFVERLKKFNNGNIILNFTVIFN